MGSLKTKFLYQLSASVLHAFIPLITFPYIARVLGPDKIGTINFVDYTAQVFITLANFGIPLYAVREVSKVRDVQKQLQKVVSELLTIHLITALFSILAFLITMRLSQAGKEAYFLIFLASLNIFFSAFSFDWFVHAFEDFKALSMRSLVIKILVAVFIFLFIKQEQDFQQYYLILIIGSILIIVYDLYYLKRKKISIGFQKGFGRHIKPLFIFFLTSTSISIYTLLDTFLLGVLTTTLAVGFYTTVLKIIRLSQNFINDLGGVLLPRISYLIEQKNETEIKRILQKSSLYVFTVAIPIGFLFFVLAPEIILVVAGKQFLNAISTLQILSLLPLMIGLSNIFGIQILIPYKQEKQLLKAVLAGSIISIGMCFIFCPFLKEDGAAIATVAAEFVVTSMLGFYASRFAPLKLPLKSFLSIFATSAFFVPIVYVSRYFIGDGLLILVSSLTACAIWFLSIQFFVFQNSMLQDILQFLMSLLRKPKYSGT